MPFTLVPVLVVFIWGTRFDILLATAIGLFSSGHVIQECIQPLTDLLSVPLLVLGFVFLQIVRFIINLWGSVSSNDDHPAKAMFFPCQTSHTRLFPKKHSFKYSYLMVGIPIGWKGTAGGLLSADLEKSKSPWYLRWFSLRYSGSWWSVDGKNYLARGSAGLQEKLEGYLESEGLDHRDYPYACLYTAAEFFGHSSNPVSFWHLYSPTKELTAVIYEVNNTFDERHMYLLEPQARDSTNQKPNSINEKYKAPRLHGKFPKEFFVSPFSFRNERYSLAAYDPLFPFMTGTGPINHTIALASQHGHPKLSARVWSTGPGIDPTKLSIWQKTVFLWSWWWVGLATLPRTVVQAYKLYVRRKLSYTVPPEPRINSIGRRADALEVVLERIFSAFLVHLVSRITIPVKITYSPVGIRDTQEIFLYSPAARRIFSEYPGKRNTVKELSIQIFTPRFYSRLIFYAFSPIRDILRDESQLLNQTLQLSDTELLETIFDPKYQGRFSNQTQPNNLSWSQRFTSYLLALLTGNTSSNPAPLIENSERGPNKPTTPEMKKTTTSNQPTPDSLIDFINTNASPSDRKTFYFQALRARITPYIANGSPLLLDIEVFSIRILGVWLAIRLLFRYFTTL